MIANSIFVASIVWLASAMYLLSELSFLAPYRDLIFRGTARHSCHLRAAFHQSRCDGVHRKPQVLPKRYGYEAGTR